MKKLLNWKVIIAATLFTACGRDQMVESDLTDSFNYGTTKDSRQVLDLYRAESATVENPGPIYLWAHPNGTTYRANLPSNELRKQLRERGVSIISWESHPTLTQANEAEVTADASLMLDWVRANAASLGLDAHRIVLGGASRGTFASWKIGHDPAHASIIKCMFMKQALPGSVDSTQPGDTSPNTVSGRAPSEWVTASSPTIQFVHLQVSADLFHSEYNSTPVMDAYAAQGLAARASRNTNVASIGAMDELYLVDFVTSCL
jgi:hypothetical protein